MLGLRKLAEFIKKEAIDMIKEALAQKVLILGVDGMDPKLTRKFVDEGKMPNVQEYIKRGACPA